MIFISQYMKYFIFVITQMFNTSLIFLLDLVCVCVYVCAYDSSLNIKYYIYIILLIIIYFQFFFVIKKKNCNLFNYYEKRSCLKITLGNTALNDSSLNDEFYTRLEWRYQHIVKKMNIFVGKYVDKYKDKYKFLFVERSIQCLVAIRNFLA